MNPSIRSRPRFGWALVGLLSVFGPAATAQPRAGSPPAAPTRADPVARLTGLLPNPAPGAEDDPPPTEAPVEPVSAPAAPAPDDKPRFEISWNNGVFFTSADKRFTFHVGGTVHYDAAWYSVTEALEVGPGGVRKFQDGVNPRRGRIVLEGTLYEAVDYKFEVELFNGRGVIPPDLPVAAQAALVTNAPGPTHAWITVKDVPVLGNVRVGNQKEWFSLEHLNPHRFLEFMERSYLFDFSQPSAFNNGFTPGVSAFRTWANDRLFTAIGGYKNTSDLLGFSFSDGAYAVTGRVAALPVYSPDERALWHVAGAMSHRDPVGGQVLIRIRDNIRNAALPLLNIIATTGLINARSQDLFNLETAAVYGPVTFQAEYTANVINGASVGAGPNLGALYFGACYVEALCFLTGESRPWNVKNAFFDRVRPNRPLRLKPSNCDGYGFGAWEVGVRYTYVDLSNKAVQGGRLDAVTFGLNWYLNANAKLQFNYDVTQKSATPNPAQGTIHGFGTRCAFDF